MRGRDRARGARRTSYLKHPLFEKRSPAQRPSVTVVARVDKR